MFPLLEICLLDGEKHLFLPPGGSSRCPTAGAEECGWLEDRDRKEKAGADEYGPVKDAPRRQRLTGLQRAAVHGKLHDAADKVVGGDLPAPMKDGLY